MSKALVEKNLSEICHKTSRKPVAGEVVGGGGYSKTSVSNIDDSFTYLKLVFESLGKKTIQGYFMDFFFIMKLYVMSSQ